MTKKELLRRVGNIDQYAGISPITYNDGKGKGIDAYRVKTGTTFDFTVLKDKAMDVFEASYKGMNLVYMTRNGLVAAPYYYPVEDGFGSTMTGGLLFTCGLKHSGGMERDNGYLHPTHGRNFMLPAVNGYAKTEWKNDDFRFELGGTTRDCLLGGPNLELHRTITCGMDKREFVITDLLENLGPTEEEFTMLYHMNLGWPFVDEDARIIVDRPAKITPNSALAKTMPDEHERFDVPNDTLGERNYLYDVEPDADGMSTIRVENKKHGFGVYFKASHETLPYFNEWKSVMPGLYVLAIEPSNNTLKGRLTERANGTAKKVAPYGIVEHKVIFGVYDL